MGARKSKPERKRFLPISPPAVPKKEPSPSEPASIPEASPRCVSHDFVTYISSSRLGPGYELFVYDISTRKFATTCIDPPFLLTQNHCITVGTFMYIICTGDCHQLDHHVFAVPFLNSPPRLVPRASIRTARLSPGLALHGEYVYAVGGLAACGIPISSCERYDVKRNVWAGGVPSLGSGVCCHAFSLGRYVYAAACKEMFDAEGQSLSRLDVLDEGRGWDELRMPVLPEFGEYNRPCTFGVSTDTVMFCGFAAGGSTNGCCEITFGDDEARLQIASPAKTQKNEKISAAAVVRKGTAYVLSKFGQLHVYDLRTRRWRVKRG